MDEWIQEDSIGFYEIDKSSEAPRQDSIPKDPTNSVMSMLVPCVARHEDHIHWVEQDHESLRREVKMLAGRVRGLE